MDGTSENVAQVRTNYGGVRFFRGNNIVLNFGSKTTVVGLLYTAGLAVVLVVTLLIRGSDSVPPSDPDPSAPLEIAVKAVAGKCQSDWVTPKSPAEVIGAAGSSGAPNSWDTWEHGKGGAVADKAMIELTVQGREPTSTVVLTGIRTKVLERRAPIVGTVVDARCGGPIVARFVDVDLDQPDPVGVGQEVKPYIAAELAEMGLRTEPVQFPYSVSSTEAEVFSVSAHTVSCDCTWVIEFDWSTGGKTGVHTVTNNGTPFRTSSSKNAVRCFVADTVDCD